MFGFVPQVFKMWRTRSVKDISLPTFIQISVGASLWVLYGMHICDLIVVAANLVTLTTLILAITLYFQYKKNR